MSSSFFRRPKETPQLLARLASRLPAVALPTPLSPCALAVVAVDVDVVVVACASGDVFDTVYDVVLLR